METSQRLVHINQTATKEVEGKGMPYPMHRVLGLLPNEAAAWKAIDSLIRMGFREQDMELWYGPEAKEGLEESFVSDSKVLNSMKGVLQEFGDEAEYLRTYKRAIDQGEYLLVVLPPSKEEKALASDLMLEAGGHAISYYDEATIETLSG